MRLHQPSSLFSPLLLAFVGMAGPLAAADVVIGGSTSAAGNLRITASSKTVLYVERWNGSAWVHKLTPPHHNDTPSISLWTIAGSDYKALASVPSIMWTSTATTVGVNGSRITSSGDVESLTFTRVITYGGSGSQFNASYSVKNNGSTTLNGLRFSEYRDAGKGFTTGAFASATNTVSLEYTESGKVTKNMLTAITGGYTYHSALFHEVQRAILGAMPNYIADSDNALAMQWSAPSLAAGATWTIETRENYSEAPARTNRAPIVAMPPNRRLGMAATGASIPLAPLVNDQDGDALTFRWSVVSGASATAVTFAPNAATRSVTATLKGDGYHVLGFSANDGELTTSATIGIQVDLPNDYTIVDGAPGFTTAGAWNSSSGSLGYGVTKCLVGAGTTSSATWAFPVTAGWYEVQAWAPVTFVYPFAQAYTIRGAGEASIRTQNLAFGVPGWRRLGLFRADANGLTVNVSGQGAVADAVRTIKYNGQVIDNGQIGFSTIGSWALESRGGMNNSTVQYTGILGAKARWGFPAANTNAHLFAYLVTNPTSNSATWSAQILRQGKPTLSYDINPTIGSARWADFGRIILSGTSALQVTNRQAKAMRADAVTLAYDTVINELGVGYQEFGTGWQTGGTIGNGASAIQRTGSPTAYARWRAALPTHSYKVWAWVPRAATACSSVRYEIGNVGTPFKITVNQRAGISGWVDLGTYSAFGLNTHPFTNSIGEVRAYRVGTDGPMQVDAIRFEPVGDVTGVTSVIAASN